MNIITVCLAIILIVLLFYILITYNSFVTSKNKVKQAKSSIDVYLTQRFDLIPNLVSCVKGYMKHEKEVQEKVASLRKAYTEMKDLNVGAELNAICNKLIAYLKWKTSFKQQEDFIILKLHYIIQKSRSFLAILLLKFLSLKRQNYLKQMKKH